MKIVRWIIDKEPALAAGIVAAFAVISAQAKTDGWTWGMLWAALPPALAVAVRSAVFSRDTVAGLVAAKRRTAAPPPPPLVAQTVIDPEAPGEMTYPATGDEPNLDAFDQRETLDPPEGMFHHVDHPDV